MNVSPTTTRIGWIGTGVMGSSMAGHLLAAGYKLAVSTRSPERAKPLLDRGAIWKATPSEVAATSDVVFTMVGTPRDVRQVVTGADGVFSGAHKGLILVDMTTSEPALAEEIASIAAGQGVVSIDAPVSGGDIGARNGTLSIMIGGDANTIAALEPLWQCIGSKSIRQGGPGAGQHTKMVNQTLVATGMVGVCEALLYAYRAGLDLPTVLESVASGAAGSWSLTNLGPRILANNFDPGFFVEHFIKDMGIALAEARRMQLVLPGLALAEQLYISVAAQGHAKDGTHALMLALAGMSNIDWQSR